MATNRNRKPSETTCRPGPCTEDKPCGASAWDGTHPYTADPNCPGRPWHFSGNYCASCQGWC
jgi:hypothetical protein